MEAGAWRGDADAVVSLEVDPPARDRRSVEELVLGNWRLAGSLAARFQHRGESKDDLEQVALIGLVKAAQRFDPSRDVSFTTYAVAVITGELKRHFRNTRWKLHVQRGLQERYLVVRDTIDDATVQWGRSPRADEIATLTGLTEEQVMEAIAVGYTFHSESLDRPGPESTPVSSEISGPVDDFTSPMVDGMALNTVLRRLSERERTIVRLRFTEELTQAQIAQRLGISQMQVSRVLRRALGTLRILLTD